MIAKRVCGSGSVVAGGETASGRSLTLGVGEPGFAVGAGAAVAAALVVTVVGRDVLVGEIALPRVGGRVGWATAAVTPGLAVGGALSNALPPAVHAARMGPKRQSIASCRQRTIRQHILYLHHALCALHPVHYLAVFLPQDGR